MADDIEFDAGKSERNFQTRGIDFEAAADLLRLARVVVEDRRRDYGERRWRAFTMFADDLYVVVYPERNGRRRIISARRGNQRERRMYERIATP